MNKIKFSLNKFSNSLFYIGIILGIIGYYQIYKERATIPSGVCPINNNRGLIIISALILISSVITSIIYERNLKKKSLKE